MLKTKLFRGFALLVVLFGALSALVAVRTLTRRVVEEAQTRVRLDLRSAWHVYDSRIREIETVVRMAASKQAVEETAATAVWTNDDTQARLERMRVSFGLDFLGVASAEGVVTLRSAPPHLTGDYRVADPILSAALKGAVASGTVVMSRDELEREAEGLAGRAFLEIKPTPHARLSPKQVEDRGLVVMSAAPIQKGSTVLGAVYGGVLVNRNSGLVDSIRNIVYDDESYGGAPVGTATIFLNDVRVATTVRGEDGNRALATRVSKEVAECVLDNGRPWDAEAFVVRDRYLTAYDPILDPAGRTIGMLYVGILKRPFQDYGRGIIVKYLLISLFALCVALVLAFVIAGRLALPIHRLVESANRWREGERPPPVSTDRACDETERLIRAFNQMTATLVDREESLKATNRSYMETLGFVSHELKSPVATIMNYVYLLGELKLGPLSEKQMKAVHSIDANSRRLVEMVRHYLNLSRIENRDLSPVRGRVAVGEEILLPLLHAAEADVQGRGMRVVNEIGEDVVLHADRNMVREVFENLLSNAVKYGRQGGEIAFRSHIEGAMVAFAVRNEGAGVPRERLPELFQKFSRLEGTPEASRQKGTGLGLYITKHIIEAHGGRVSADSEPGTWMEFTFTLPAFAGKEEKVQHG